METIATSLGWGHPPSRHPLIFLGPSISRPCRRSRRDLKMSLSKSGELGFWEAKSWNKVTEMSPVIQDCDFRFIVAVSANKAIFWFHSNIASVARRPSPCCRREWASSRVLCVSNDLIQDCHNVASQSEKIGVTLPCSGDFIGFFKALEIWKQRRACYRALTTLSKELWTQVSVLVSPPFTLH